MEGNVYGTSANSLTTTTTPTNVMLMLNGNVCDDFFSNSCCVTQQPSLSLPTTTIDDCFDFDLENFLLEEDMIHMTAEPMKQGEEEQGVTDLLNGVFENYQEDVHNDIAPIVLENKPRPVPQLTLPPKIIEKTSSKPSVASVMDTQSGRSEGSWKIVQTDPSIIKDDCYTQITIRSRKCQSVPDIVSDQLYSSVSYEMRHEAFGSFLKDIAANQQVLFVKVQVIDPVTKMEVLKSNKSILSTVSEGAISKNAKGEFVHDIKIKFNSCSYHFDRASFQFRVSYSCLNKDKPFLIKESSEFMIFARKPTGSTAAAAAPVKKRKRSSSKTDSDDEEQSSKRIKSDVVSKDSTTNSQGLASFSNNLSDLFTCLDKLSQEERKHAVSMLAQQIGSCQEFPRALLNHQH